GAGIGDGSEAGSDEGLVVDDRAGAGGLAGGDVGQAGQVDGEGFVELGNDVAEDGDVDLLRGDAGVEGDWGSGEGGVGAAGGGDGEGGVGERAVIVRRDGGVVGGRGVEGDGAPADGGEGHGERGGFCPAGAFGDARVADRQVGKRVVVQDCAEALAVGDGGVG